MPRKILICGNCQAELIANAVRQIFAGNRDLVMLYRPDFDPSVRGEVASLIATADEIFLQRTVFEIRWLSNVIPAGARVHYFPVMRLTFMWPDIDKERFDLDADNSPLAETGGSSTLTMARAETGPLDARIERYLASDLAAEHRAERLMRMDRAAMNHLARDTDLDLWGPFERSFRRQRPFFSSLHPNWPLLEPVARYVVDVIGGAPAQHVDAIMNRHADENYFSLSRSPIHPSIVKMFDLQWGEFDYDMYTARYGFADSESYCKLYLRPEDLAGYRTYYAARAGRQRPLAIDAARQILHQSIGRPSWIHLGLAELLADLRQTGEGLDEGRRILELYPFDVPVMIKVAGLGQRLKDFAIAEQAIAAAAASAGDSTVVLRAKLALARASGEDEHARSLARRILARDSLSRAAQEALGVVDNQHLIEGSHWQWRAAAGRQQREMELWRQEEAAGAAPAASNVLF